MQSDNFVVEVTEHAFDLMVAAFMQGQQGAIRAENQQLSRSRGEVFVGEIQAVSEGFDAGRVNGLFRLDSIDLA